MSGTMPDSSRRFQHDVTRPVVWAAPARVDTAPESAVGPSVDGVVVLDVSGAIDEVGNPVLRAVQHALANNPRGVVCSLVGASGEAGHSSLDRIAALGRHVQQWPGTPIAIACPDEKIRAALRSKQGGRHLRIVPSIRHAWFEIVATAIPVEATIRLAPHPSSGRASRAFLTRTWLDWDACRAIGTGCLVISELVTNAVRYSNNAVEVSLSKHRRLLRIAVRDSECAFPHTRRADPARIGGRGIPVVQAISRDFGVLPTPTRGKVVWAVLDS